MIFGRTFEQKKENKLKDEDFRIKFAWYPVQLNDGKWVWLQYVKWRYEIVWGDKLRKYYLLESEEAKNE